MLPTAAPIVWAMSFCMLRRLADVVDRSKVCAQTWVPVRASISCAVTDLVGNTPEAAFDHILGSKLPAQLLLLHGLLLVREGGITSQDPQLIEAAQNGDKFFTDAVRIKLLIGIAREIVEWKNSERWPLGSTAGAAKPARAPPGA